MGLAPAPVPLAVKVKVAAATRESPSFRAREKVRREWRGVRRESLFSRVG